MFTLLVSTHDSYMNCHNFNLSLRHINWIKHLFYLFKKINGFYLLINRWQKVAKLEFYPILGYRSIFWMSIL